MVPSQLCYSVPLYKTNDFCIYHTLKDKSLKKSALKIFVLKRISASFILSLFVF